MPITSRFCRQHLPAIIGVLLFGPGLRAGQAQGPFQFDGGTNFGAGSLVYAIVADVNGDQKPDLLAQGAPAPGGVPLVLLLGDGAGGFSSIQPVPAVTGPAVATLGDTNVSGWANLAALDNGALRFLAVSNSTYQSEATVALPPGSVAIASGDFNEDGHRDYAVASFSDGSLSVLLGNGPGILPGAPTRYPLKGGPCFVEAADLDHDGHVDLAVVCRTTGQVALFFGRGNGTFQRPMYCKVGKDARFLAVGDLNNDGLPDIVTASYGSKSISVLLQTKPRHFRSHKYNGGSGPTAVAIADLNCDGLPDIAFADFDAGRVAILAGVGSGKFVPAGGILIGASPSCVRVADFNGDGVPDICTVNASAERSVTVLLNRCRGH